MNGIFITGTDTNVGKTTVGALLLAELRERKINAAPMKPAQTGCEPTVNQTGSADLTAPDLDYSLSMASMEVPADTYEHMAPYRFEPACSPHLAADMAGVDIALSKITGAEQALSSRYEALVIEGAGGILVPLNQRETMLDLMRKLGYPVLLVSRPGLGTINHTLLSISMLRSAGLEVAGIIFTAANDAPPGYIEKDNITTIEQFGDAPVLGTIPHCAQLASSHPVYTDLPERVIQTVKNMVDELHPV